MTRGRKNESLSSAIASKAKAEKPRSLSAALREVGLTEAAPIPHDKPVSYEAPDEPTVLLPRKSSDFESAATVTSARSPTLVVFAEPEEEPEPTIVRAAPLPAPGPNHGVVSPPPWMRAARRGRVRARLLNTFGWAMTIAIAGSIIGLAGRYLLVAPVGIQTTMQARQ